MPKQLPEDQRRRVLNIRANPATIARLRAHCAATGAVQARVIDTAIERELDRLERKKARVG